MCTFQIFFFGGRGWQGRRTSHVPPSLPPTLIFKIFVTLPLLKIRFKSSVTPPHTHTHTHTYTHTHTSEKGKSQNHGASINSNGLLTLGGLLSLKFLLHMASIRTILMTEYKRISYTWSTKPQQNLSKAQSGGR